MHIWPDASTKVSKTQKTLLDVFFIFRIYYDLKQIWFAEHTKIVVPKALPEDKFICTALLKDMDESKYVFDKKFVEPYTEKEKVVLNMSEEGGIMFLEEGREDKYEELRMTIKSSWEQMQKMDCNNEEVVPKMQEISTKDDSNSAQVKKIRGSNLMITYNWMMMQQIDVPMSHQEAPEDDSISVQVKKDKRVEFDDYSYNWMMMKIDVPMSHQEAPEDDSISVQVQNDKRVELVFGDDVENMDLAKILIELKRETPRLETSATAINPEPTPIVTETTSIAPIAPEAKVADESQEANHTAPETTSSASPKPASEDPNVTVPEAKLGDTTSYLVFNRNFKKRKASESNVQKDDILAENKKAKDEHIAARSAEIIQKREEEGFNKGYSKDGNGKTSLEKVTRESAKTIKKLQEDGESKPSTAKIDEFALATKRFLNAAHDKKRILLILETEWGPWFFWL
ncbi:hypothetical protein MKW92_007404 [Papaver armeniacum]|nr:hypothetical protein MKW92_007404 [Papaver armeniacum]